MDAIFYVLSFLFLFMTEIIWMFLICLLYSRIKKRPLRFKGISLYFCLLQSANQVQSSYHSRTVLNVSAIQITVFMWLKAKQTLYYCIEKLDLVKKSNSKERDSNGSKRRRRRNNNHRSKARKYWYK